MHQDGPPSLTAVASSQDLQAVNEGRTLVPQEEPTMVPEQEPPIIIVPEPNSEKTPEKRLPAEPNMTGRCLRDRGLLKGVA